MVMLFASSFPFKAVIAENGRMIKGSRSKIKVATTIMDAFIFSFLNKGIMILRNPCHKLEVSLAHTASMFFSP